MVRVKNSIAPMEILIKGNIEILRPNRRKIMKIGLNLHIN
jgi:hypothetical protein